MKVLFCLCVCITAATAHIIGYPVAPVSYQLSPLPTIARPILTYTGLQGYPLPLFTYNVIPNNAVFPGVPGVVHYLPLAPADDKGKPDKKPGNKDEKDKKEETTDEPKKEEEETKTGEAEDLEQ